MKFFLDVYRETLHWYLKNVSNLKFILEKWEIVSKLCQKSILSLSRKFVGHLVKYATLKIQV